MKRRFVLRVLALILILSSVLFSASAASLVTVSKQNIGAEAYMGNKKMTQLLIKSSVKSIGARAFKNCTALKEIRCESKNVKIASSAFQNTNVKKVYCYINSTMDKFARGTGVSIVYIDAFKIKCDTSKTAYTGMDITWKLTNIMPGANVKNNRFKYAVYKNNKCIYTSPITTSTSFTYTPTSAGTYYIKAYINNSLTTTDMNSDKLNVVGTVTFGKYNGEAIKWKILDVKDGKALLISEKVLDKGSYFNPSWIKYKYTYWSGSYVGKTSVNYRGSAPESNSTRITGITSNHIPLKNGSYGKESDLYQYHCRYWCNSVFYKNAFSSSERARIVKTTLSNPDNKTYKVDGGPSTQDYVFFLSYDEIQKYMPSKSARTAKTTSKAKNVSYYWLRSPGKYRTNAMYVYCGSGAISTSGSDVGHTLGYRPAMWVKLP